MAAKNPSTAVPALADIFASVAASEEAATAAVAKAASEKEAAMVALDEQLAPYRAERDAIIAEKVAAIVGLEEALAPISAKYEKRQAKLDADRAKEEEEARAPFAETIDGSDAKLAAHEAKTFEETGAPAVLQNMDKAPSPKVKATKAAGTGTSTRKTPKVSHLGVLAPVMVTAPHRYPQLDPTNPTSVVFEVSEVDGELVLFAKRVDHKVNGNHVINQEAVDTGEYLHFSTVASDVTTKPGWVSTRDAMYALASVAGILGDFPDYAPESDLSDILVNGAPLAATPTTEPVVTIEETV